MERKIYSQLLDWKENNQGKSALLLEGARRIGKSYIVEQDVHFENVKNVKNVQNVQSV